MNGKGDRDRTDKAKFRKGYDKVNWPSKDEPKQRGLELPDTQKRAPYNG